MKRVNCIAQATVILSLLAPAALVSADELTIPVASQGQSDIETPRKGVSQSQVTSQFGQPLKTSGPVGDPPIDRWDYENFSVYFEYDHVIHSVRKHKKP